MDKHQDEFEQATQEAAMYLYYFWKAHRVLEIILQRWEGVP